ncbi:MAG: hypothetical protein ACFFDI_02800 [Promethearchaeota archaeon]
MCLKLGCLVGLPVEPGSSPVQPPPGVDGRSHVVKAHPDKLVGSCLEVIKRVPVVLYPSLITKTNVS